jgi:hypothetical protein
MIDGHFIVNQELRFTGNHAAFVNGNHVQDFFALLSGNAIWLTRNMFARVDDAADQLYNTMSWMTRTGNCKIYVKFNKHSFVLLCWEKLKNRM